MIPFFLRNVLLSLVLAAWTKMRSLAGSLADGALADAILIPPCPPILPTNIRRLGVLEKITETINTKNIY